ncbi:hydantoinase/oxoprolinase N-terminal domain-containing protein [Teichococcus aestuarii]|uniref:hydantoinase/oxoprolinase N-terminal domain-containing protein n=1 Tax=Teichococcus aestuarii TaxID=568898 RepID=UPI00360FCE33
MAWRVGVDIGGTFADFVALDTGSGRLTTLKVLTTPQQPGQDVAAGLRRRPGRGWSRRASSASCMAPPWG